MNNNKPQVDNARRALLKALGITGMAVAVDRLLLPRWLTPTADAEGQLNNGGSKDSDTHSAGGPTEQLGSEFVLGNNSPGFGDGPDDLLSDSGFIDDASTGLDFGSVNSRNERPDIDSLFGNEGQDFLGSDKDQLVPAPEDPLFESLEQDILSAGCSNDICISEDPFR